MRGSEEDTHHNNSPNWRRQGPTETIVSWLDSFKRTFVRILLLLMALVFVLGWLLAERCSNGDNNTRKYIRESEPPATAPAHPGKPSTQKR